VVVAIVSTPHNQQLVVCYCLYLVTRPRVHQIWRYKWSP